jgi:hypothetical protein
MVSPTYIQVSEAVNCMEGINVCLYSFVGVFLSDWHLPYKLAEAVTLRICVREMPFSNLGRDTEIMTEILRSGYQSLEANGVIDHAIRSRPLPSTAFPVHCSVSSYHVMLYIVRDADSVANKEHK